MRETINCGDKVKDRITQVIGVVVGVCDWDTGVQKISVRSQDTDKDGSPKAAFMFDTEELTVIEKGAIPAVASPEQKYKFGDVVEDRHTGFKGTVRQIRYSLSGCIQYGVYPPKLEKNRKGAGFTPADGFFFLQEELEKVGSSSKSPVLAGAGRTGPSEFGRSLS